MSIAMFQKENMEIGNPHMNTQPSFPSSHTHYYTIYIHTYFSEMSATHTAHISVETSNIQVALDMTGTISFSKL